MVLMFVYNTVVCIRMDGADMQMLGKKKINEIKL